MICKSLAYIQLNTQQKHDTLCSEKQSLLIWPLAVAQQFRLELVRVEIVRQLLKFLQNPPKEIHPALSVMFFFIYFFAETQFINLNMKYLALELLFCICIIRHFTIR